MLGLPSWIWLLFELRQQFGRHSPWARTALFQSAWREEIWITESFRLCRALPLVSVGWRFHSADPRVIWGPAAPLHSSSEMCFAAQGARAGCAPLLQGGGRAVITPDAGLWQLLLLVLTLVADAGTKHRFCCNGNFAV